MDGRHHRVSREIIFIPVPFEGGSPKEGHRQRPPRYPHQEREHWNGPPRRISKAQRLHEFLRRIAENDRLAREHVRPDAAGLARWLAMANF